VAFLKFQTRHSITFKAVCGESGSVSSSTIEAWKVQLSNLMQGKNPKDIFNLDETGLFYQCLPDKTLTLKNQKCNGGKLSKHRITVLVGANMDGSEKLPLLVIGKYANPRCMKGVRSLPLSYTSNSRAWMTMYIFEVSTVSLQ
jgi:hypothetical protein